MQAGLVIKYSFYGNIQKLNMAMECGNFPAMMNHLKKGKKLVRQIRRISFFPFTMIQGVYYYFESLAGAAARTHVRAAARFKSEWNAFRESERLPNSHYSARDQRTSENVWILVLICSKDVLS